MMIFSFAIITMLFFVTPPTENKDNINIVIGFLMGTGLSAVVQYYLGSSKESEKKNETIKNLSEK